MGQHQQQSDDLKRQADQILDVAFLGVHLPAYLRDAGQLAEAGANAMPLIALANAFGTFACGKPGDLYRPGGP